MQSQDTLFLGGVGGTVACESALRSAGTLVSRVRAQPSAPRPDGGPKSLRLPCCGLAISSSPSSALLISVGDHVPPQIPIFDGGQYI
ncbi:hypothetical protein PoB_006254200 [Plakobranchus ocellatus]|uniref:Uncharacterized protein n=1 Tax=Plakobranchus ocellatus TaxID=259542 RepID=A0AAV4CVV1_9GAST|nr:hypothetical protein PoB_006254200 [Plakobranchus ocellatus]